jgi:hypothetical protein
MGRYAYGQRRRPQRRGGCTQGFFALIFVGSLGLLVYIFAVRPLITRAVAESIAGAPVGGAQTDAIAEQAGAAIPDAVAALPSGEIVVSEAEVNSFLAARPDALAPLDAASMRFTGGRAVADLSAYGLSSTASVNFAARDGRLLVIDPRIDGPLSVAISADQLADTLAERLNAALVAQNRRIEAVRVEEGQIVLVTS